MTLDNIQKKKLLYEFLMMIGFLIIGIAIFIAILKFELLYLLYMVPIFLSGVLISNIAASKFKNLSIAFKKQYVSLELQKLVPNSIYDALQGIDENVVKKSKILKAYEFYESEDYFKGELFGKSFQSADLHLRDIGRSRRANSEQTVFLGRFFVIDLNKKIPHDVYILPREQQWFNMFEGIEPIETESLDLNERFNIYSRQSHALFYVMKPRIIEKLLEFSNIYRDVCFSFIDQYVFIAINTNRDAFDLQMFRSLDLSLFNDIKNEIALIKDLIFLLN
jgi:hypothetical protein